MKIWLPTIKTGSGSEVYVERLAEGLAKVGIQALITALPHQAEFCPSVWRLVTPPAGIDLVHANSWFGFACRRPGIPLVVTEHHCVMDPALRPYQSRWQAMYHQGWVRRWENASLRCADRVVAVSEFTRRALASCMQVRQVEVIHNWVDTEQFSPAATAPRRAGPFRLLFVGNAGRRKGGDLLQPLADSLGAGFELRATGGLRGARTGQSGTLISLGRLALPELLDEYRQADAVLFPSRYEGFGYVALEAAAVGKPVVGFRGVAIEEVVEDEVSGILVPMDDVVALAQACRRLAADPVLVAAFGAAGRSIATGRLSQSNAIERYVSLYESVLHDGPRRNSRAG